MSRVSEAQRQKIDESLLANANKFRDSELIKAISADIEMFGNDALREEFSPHGSPFGEQ